MHTLRRLSLDDSRTVSPRPLPSWPCLDAVVGEPTAANIPSTGLRCPPKRAALPRCQGAGLTFKVLLRRRIRCARCLAARERSILPWASPSRFRRSVTFGGPESSAGLVPLPRRAASPTCSRSHGPKAERQVAAPVGLARRPCRRQSWPVHDPRVVWDLASVGAAEPLGPKAAWSVVRARRPSLAGSGPRTVWRGETLWAPCSRSCPVAAANRSVHEARRHANLRCPPLQCPRACPEGRGASSGERFIRWFDQHSEECACRVDLPSWMDRLALAGADRRSGLTRPPTRGGGTEVP